MRRVHGVMKLRMNVNASENIDHGGMYNWVKEKNIGVKNRMSDIGTDYLSNLIIQTSLTLMIIKKRI